MAKEINRKQEILVAATQCFALFGYKGTTMDQVAKMATVGKGTIYTFFNNKEELFNEILQNLIYQVKAVAEKAINNEQPFFENMHGVLYKVLDFRRSHELIIKLSQEVKVFGTPMAQEALKKIEEAILYFVQKQVRMGIEKGEVKECDPQITAFVLLKLYIALVYDWEKSNQPLDKKQIDQLFQLYLIEGLAP